MRVVQQTTIAKSVSLSGVGIHTGVACRITLRPAAASRGVSFRRIAVGAAPSAGAIKADIANLSDTRLNTGLKNSENAGIGTIEHLMAALSLAGVDNIIVDVGGPELPALDGSAAPYLAAIDRAGIKRLGPPREAIKIMAPLDIADGDRMLRAEPFDGRIIDISVEFPEAAIGAQRVTIDLSNPVDIRRVAEARTFCRLAEVEQMRAAGLGLGGSFDNAIVVDGARILNEGGLRHPQEFALHKALDLIGDLALAGAPVIGRIRAIRPGHDLNTRFVARLLEDRTRFERIVAEEPAAQAMA